MKRFKLEWKSSEKVWPSLDPHVGHCTTQSCQQPAITFCGGWLYTFAETAQRAIEDFKRNPDNRHAFVTATEA